MKKVKSKMVYLYFAYGSNMNEDELKVLKIRILKRRKALLQNHKLALTRHSKNRQGGVVDVIPSEGDVVEGVLYELPDDAKSKIEEKEGVTSNAYREKQVNVETSGRIIRNVITYEVYKKENPPPASEEYKKSVLKGAKQHDLSQQYIRDLERVLEKRRGS